MKWRIRRAGGGDASALALVGAATFLESYAGNLPGADIIAHCAERHAPALYARWAEAPGHALWLVEAEEGGAPIGYQVLAPPEVAPFAARPGDVELKRIYLLSRLHGTGAGHALFAESVAWTRAQGLARMLVGLWEGNEKAMAFYRRQGFAPVGERPFTVGGSTYIDPVLALDL